MVLNTFIHNDNTEEEYYWDDYDLKITSKPINIHTTRHIPKITNRPINLHSNEKIKILVSRKLSVSTQTDNPPTYDNTTQTTDTPTCGNSCDTTSQTFPKFYFPRTKSNFNFEPFNTNIIL